MNKLIITIITTLTLAVAGAAFAQNPGGQQAKRSHGDQRGMQAMPQTQQIMRAIKRLDLDEGQKENIKATLDALKTDLRPIMQEMKSGQQQLRELVKARSYDAAAVATLAEQEGKLAANRIVLTSGAISKALSYLTDEQRTQLDEMAAERKKRAKKQQNRVGES